LSLGSVALKPWRARAAACYPSDLLANPRAVRLTLLAALCWSRTSEISDALADLLIQLVARINTRAERKVENQVSAEAMKVQGKTTKLFRIAEESIARPDETVRAVVYPVVDEVTLRRLVAEAKADEKAFQARVRMVLTSSYSSYYSRMLPQLPGALDFKCNNTAYRPVIRDVARKLTREARRLEERDTYGQAFLQTMQLRLHSRAVERFVLARRFGKIVADLLGAEGVRVYHDQSLFKEPGGGITPWHQDQYYWPLDSDRTITAWVPLQAVPAAMGPLSFAAGSQGFSFGRDLAISDESEAELQEALAGQGFPVVSEPYDLGTVSFHSGWTFHRAGANFTDIPRRVMTMIYVDADINITAPVNGPQRNDLKNWLGGAAPGPLPDGGLSPERFSG